jgi:glycine cleavage system H protein
MKFRNAALFRSQQNAVATGSEHHIREERHKVEPQHQHIEPAGTPETEASKGILYAIPLLSGDLMSNIPTDLKYTKSHEWVRVEGDIATIGITDFAQSELGDVVFVELPNAGRVLAAGESFGSVESVKTVSDIYAPIAGEVVEANDALGAQSELVNTDPYGKGFMIRLRINPSDADSLLSADDYQGIVG